MDAHDEIRDGAWVAEIIDLLNLEDWPKAMRVIVRKERPHPGPQLTITEVDGDRITAFATNTPTGGPSTQLADLELRHRRRARCEDRIRIAKAPPAQGRREVPHRPARVPAVRLRPEPDLGRNRRPGRGDHRLDGRCSP